MGTRQPRRRRKPRRLRRLQWLRPLPAPNAADAEMALERQPEEPVVDAEAAVALPRWAPLVATA